MRYLLLPLLSLLTVGCESTGREGDLFYCQVIECPSLDDMTLNDMTLNDMTLNDMTLNDMTLNDMTSDVEDSSFNCMTPDRENLHMLTWVNIPAGSFMMGSDANDSEQPIHQVTVQAFQMSETEITVGQYRLCVNAGRCSQPNTSDSCTWSTLPSNKEDHPINCIDWGEARTFAVWVGGDLPTEAQWEYAARGGENYQYAGSDNTYEVAWYNENSEGSTRPVKTKRANGYGLYDMSGNVWEWTLDEWHSNYEGAPNQAETPWGDIASCSQVCENGSSRRIDRGGGWDTYARFLRVALRDDGLSDVRFLDLGFRVRKTLP